MIIPLNPKFYKYYMDLEQKSINFAKGLIMDTVRKANPGHTGGPLSLDFSYVLFKEFLKS